MKLEPPDYKQCQTIFDGRIRCKIEPTVIITEKIKDKDGQKGSMSLCNYCFDIFKKQDNRPVVVTKIKQKKEKKLTEQEEYTFDLMTKKDTEVFESLIAIMASIDAAVMAKDMSLANEERKRKDWIVEYLMKKGYLR